jgi:hypothetical protein
MTENPFTEDEIGFTIPQLREAINYIRSMERGERWRILPHREHYGPTWVLTSWVEHASEAFDYIEALEAENAELREREMKLLVTVGTLLTEDRFDKTFPKWITDRLRILDNPASVSETRSVT